jgi:hypothetical protein
LLGDAPDRDEPENDPENSQRVRHKTEDRNEREQDREYPEHQRGCAEAVLRAGWVLLWGYGCAWPGWKGPDWGCWFMQSRSVRVR